MTAQPVYAFGGSGAVLHVAVANGFPPQTYAPFVQPFTHCYRAICLPPRALWQDEPPPAHLLEWDQTIAHDLLDGLRAHDLREVTAIGHSFGSIATMLAAITEPQRFRAVILLDPTILPQPFLWLARAGRLIGIHHPLAQRAEKRRAHFESFDSAYDYFRGKRLFAGWHEDALRGYVQSFVPDGDGIKLAWSPEWEAYYFRTVYTRSWSALPKLRATGLPVLLIRGETSDTLLPQAAARICRMLPGITYAEVSGHGHLFPQTAPEETGWIIQEWINKLS